MKTLIFLLIVILFASLSHAQSTFSLPVLTDVQKHQIASVYCYNNIITGINFAKSKGMTVEEYAKFVGDQFTNHKTDFTQFVNSFLYAWVSLSENPEIVSQSERKIVIKAKHVYPFPENAGSLWNVSFKELISWLELIYEPQCNNIGCNFKMEITPEGVVTTIEKRQ